MKFTADDLRAAYRFLKRLAFNNDRRLPAANSVTFVAKPLKAHGYHGMAGGQHCIWVDTTDTKSLDMLLRIVAHEMLHAALGHGKVPSKYAHGKDFQEAARAIEIEMGWPKGSI